MGPDPSAVRCLFHADLDAFYASVEQLDNPALRGKPVLVGGSPEQRGVVAACSYEARAFGIHSAMPMRTAVIRCPNAIIIPPRFSRYHEVSATVMSILRDLTPLVEPMSLDEAYLDVTDAVAAGSTPRALAEVMKHRVKEETGLTISVGAATSKSVAKIASDMKKPDGLVIVEPGTERAFLAPLPVRKLGGIGPKTEEQLRRHDIETLGQLASQPPEWLAREYGQRGAELSALSRGEDNRPVVVERETKSISAETTFAQDQGDPETLHARLAALTERVAERVERSGQQGRTVTIKLRLADFTTFTRSMTPSVPPRTTEEIQAVAGQLLDRELDPSRRFRLLGVGISGFGHGERQPSLFDLSPQDVESAS